MAQNPQASDPTIYPVDDGMGENSLELDIRIVLVPLLRRYLALLGRAEYVGGNLFIYWRQFDPTRSVAPDAFVVPGLPPDAQPASLKLWELGPGCVPSFALEVVSQDAHKDYVLAPLRYDELGVRELVVYDPEFGARRDGHRFQVFRRGKRHGLRLVQVTDEGRVRSEVLGCFLREVPEGSSVRLRLATGQEGEELFPTEAEAERAARESAVLTERAAREAAVLTERAAKEAALERVRELEAKVRELEGKLGG